MLAGGLVAAAGTDEQKAELLGGLVAGESVLAFAHTAPGAPLGRAAAAVTRLGLRRRLDARPASRSRCSHGARADQLVVSAALPETAAPALFLVAGDASGLTRTGYATFDGGRAARRRLRRHRRHAARRRRPTPSAAHRHGRSTAPAIAAANEALGAMQFALPPRSEYLKTRKQFGVTAQHASRPSTFRAADMYVSLELATSIVDLGDDGARRPAPTRRSPRPPPGPGCRSAGRRGTSARRRSSCTAASR